MRLLRVIANQAHDYAILTSVLSPERAQFHNAKTQDIKNNTALLLNLLHTADRGEYTIC